MTDSESKKKPFFRNMADVFVDIYKNRNILSAMVKRNTAGRYKSSFLGFLWNMLAPILTILVLYIVFTTIKTRPISDFWIYLCAGMFPCSFMSGCLRGRAILNNASFITKMKFPREISVISDALMQMISVVMVYLMVIIVILSYGNPMDWSAALMIPVMLAVMFVFGLGCSFLVSTICVFVRDVGHFLSIAMRIVVWITPTFFMANEATGLLGALVWFNPFTYFVEVFHQCIYYGVFPNMYYVGVCCVLATVMFFIGWAVFEHYKSRFPEVL